MTVWTEKTEQAEAWVNNPPATYPRAGFSLGFSPRPAFMTAPRVGLWAERDEQPETWTVA